MANNNGTVERFLDIDKIWAIIIKNWIEMRRDPVRLVPLIMFPVMMILIFGYTSGAVPKQIPGAMVDYDNSQLSMQVQRDLYANDLFSISHKVGSQEEGRKLIDSGQIKILFIIPPGFEKDINNGQTAQLSVIVDESDPSVAQITKATTLSVIAGISEQITLQKLAAIPLSAQTAQAQLQQASQALNNIGQSNDQATTRAMSSNLRDAQAIATQTNNQMAQLALSLKNKLGMVVVPNEVAGISPGSTSEYMAALDLLATSDAQTQTLQQIAIYGGVAGATRKLGADGQKIYSAGQSVASSNRINKQYALVSANFISNANSEVKQASDQAQSATANPIAMNVLQPYGSGRKGLDFLLPSILALIIFQGAAAGLGRAVAGERENGSLTRMFLTPTSNVTIIVGTLLFYLSLEVMRSSLIVVIAVTLFGVSISGGIIEIIAIIGLYALGSTGVGMIISVLTKSQEQYMAISFLVSFPIIFLSGVFSPIQTLPPFLRTVTTILPTTYAADALRAIMIKGFALTSVIGDLIFLAGFGVLTITLSVLLFKREIA